MTNTEKASITAVQVTEGEAAVSMKGSSIELFALTCSIVEALTQTGDLEPEQWLDMVCQAVDEQLTNK